MALPLYSGVLHDPRYILDGSRSDTPVLLGALYEILVAISVVGTGVTLFPIVRRQNEGAALAYAVGRVMEATVIVVGIISLLSVATLRPGAAGAGAGHGAALVTTGKALVALHHRMPFC
jgi:hypothetical protein